MKNAVLTCMFMFALQTISNAHAIDWADGKGQVHGFLSQGLVTSSHNNFYGESSDGISLDFREIGLNASYRLTPGILLSGQAISRRAGEMDIGNLWIDYAFADFSLVNDAEKSLGIRIGRMKNPYGLYTDTRDVAFTRPGAIVPQPIYFDISRRFALSGDGIHFYGSHQFAGGNIDAVLGLVKLPINDRSSKATFVGVKAPGDLEQDRLTTGLRLLYESGDNKWLGGVSYFSLHQEYHPDRGDAFLPRSALLEPLVVSLRYSGEKWIMTGEYMIEKVEFAQQGVTYQDSYAESWYLQSQYKFMPDWELLLRYDSSEIDRDDPNGRKFSAATGGPAFTRYARDWVAGVRYDITPSFMVRAEVHHIKGTFWTSSLDNPNVADTEKNWDMFMLLGSWHF